MCAALCDRLFKGPTKPLKVDPDVHSLMKVVHIVLFRFLVLLGFLMIVFGEMIRYKPRMNELFFIDNDLDSLNHFTKELPASFPQSLRSSENEELPKTWILLPLATTLSGLGATTLAYETLFFCLMYFKPPQLPDSICWLLYMLGCTFKAVASLATTALLGMLMETALQGLLPDYKGLADTEESSLTLNMIMQSFNCCGVNDVSDFEDLTAWPPGDDILTKVNLPTNVSTARWHTPIACCRNGSLVEYGCFVEGIASEVNNFMGSSCMDVLTSQSREPRGHVVVALVVLAVLYLGQVGVAVYFYLATTSTSSK